MKNHFISSSVSGTGFAAFALGALLLSACGGGGNNTPIVGQPAAQTSGMGNGTCPPNYVQIGAACASVTGTQNFAAQCESINYTSQALVSNYSVGYAAGGYGYMNTSYTGMPVQCMPAGYGPGTPINGGYITSPNGYCPSGYMPVAGAPGAYAPVGGAPYMGAGYGTNGMVMTPQSLALVRHLSHAKVINGPQGQPLCEVRTDLMNFDVTGQQARMNPADWSGALNTYLPVRAGDKVIFNGDAGWKQTSHRSHWGFYKIETCGSAHGGHSVCGGETSLYVWNGGNNTPLAVQPGGSVQFTTDGTLFFGLDYPAGVGACTYVSREPADGFDLVHCQDASGRTFACPGI